jgi:hypothetical protein
MTIGDDGFPIIVTRRDTGTNLFLAIHCLNVACTATTTSVIDTGTSVGYGPGINIGTDGFPIIAYVDGDAGYDEHKYAKCGDVACTASLISTSTLDIRGSGRSEHSIAIGTNGFPVISYMASTTNSLAFINCNNENCSPNASSSANLTSTNSDLSNYLDDAAYTNVATSDDIYDSLSAGTSTRLAYLFTHKNANNTDPITATWEGQVSKATTTYLKIYNVNSSAWEVLASNAAPAANTDFTLTGTQSTNLSNYYDGSNVVYLRVETGTTTASTTLKTDQFTASFGGGAPTLNLLHYRWREDNGTEVGATWSAAEDTALATTSNTYKGDRKRLRMLVQNTGAGATTTPYLLEYASSSCTSWHAVPTQATRSWQEWVMDLSQWVPDGAVTSNVASGLTDPNANFVAGRILLQANQTTALTLDSATSQFTENEYGIRSTPSAETDLTYCFRMTNAGSATNFTYSVQPRIVINPHTRPQVGGGGVESSGSGAPVGGGTPGGGGGLEGGGGGGPVGGGGSGGGGGLE